MTDRHPDDYKVLGRWGARVSSTASMVYDDDWRDDDTPMLMFFDGKSFTPVTSSGTNNQGSGLFPGYPGYAPLNGRKLQHNDYHYALAYLGSEYAFNCINLLAGDVARAKLGVRNKQTKEDIPNHPLLQAVTWARQTYQQNIIELWTMGRYIWGEVYIEPCKLGWRNPLTGREMYGGVRWLNPIVTEPIVLYDSISYFEYTGGMRVQQFKPNELVYDKFGAAVSDIRGQSRIAVALDAINIDREIKRYTLDTLLKDMRMAGIITGRQGSGITMPQLDEFLDRLKQQKDSRLVALPLAVEYQRIQQEVDGSQLQLSNDAKIRIAATIGVPPSVAGAWESMTYQSSPAQMLFYYQHVVDPLCGNLATVMTDTTLPFFDDSGKNEVYLDISDTMALVEDKKQKAEIQNSRLAAGTITINEHRKAMGDDAIEGGDVLLIPSGATITPVDKLAQMGQMSAQPLLPDGTPIAANTAMLPPPAPEPTPEPGVKEACLMLKIGADPDLIALQQRVKQICADMDVRWETPDEFHVTLVYTPSLTDTQAAQLILALNDLAWDEEMELRVGSLGSFDTLQQYAIRFLISKKADIAGLQESAYELFADIGIGVRQLHQPARYTPHVTMGYANQPFPRTTFKGKIGLTPKALELWHGDEMVYSRAFREADEPDEPDEETDAAKAFKAELLRQQDVGYTVESPHPALSCSNCRWFSDQPNTRPCHIINSGPLTIVKAGWCDQHKLLSADSTVIVYTPDYTPSNPNFVAEAVPEAVQAELIKLGEATPETFEAGQDTVDDELKAWRKKTHNGGASKAVKFAARLTPDHVVDWVKAELDQLGMEAPRAQINALFDDVDLVRGVKSYSETRDKFKAELRQLIESARGNETNRRNFSSAMRTLARRSGLDTVFNAFEDAGAAIESIDPSTLTIFRAWQAETSEYIANFSKEIFTDGLTDAEVSFRVDLWANKTLDDMYYSALREAGSHIKATWKLGNTEDHCNTCKTRHGQVKTMEEWGKVGFPRDRRLDCGGWKCDCDLFDDKGRRLGAR